MVAPSTLSACRERRVFLFSSFLLLAISTTGCSGTLTQPEASVDASVEADVDLDTSFDADDGATGDEQRDADFDEESIEEDSGPRPSNVAACEVDDLHGEILAAWDARRDAIRSDVQGSDTTPYNLYNVQITTNPLFSYALRRQNETLTHELLETYLGATSTLDSTDRYMFYYFPGSPRESEHQLDRVYRMWLNQDGWESVLSSVQFISLVCQAMYSITSTEISERSALMTEFVDSFAPVVEDHFQRLVLGVTVDDTIAEAGPFQVYGWGCTYGGEPVERGMNHRARTQKLLDRTLGDAESHGYCNAVQDTDLWLYAGVAQYVAAHLADGVSVPISPENFNAYLSYLEMATMLLSSRVTFDQTLDFGGDLVTIAHFDRGAWDDYGNYAYSGYDNLTVFPDTSEGSLDRVAADDVGWDVSHARRFVEAFDALHAHRHELELSFPTTEYMEAMAATFAYNVFNGDFERPLFTNFMDGTNGWYRVEYSDRNGFGYGPWDMSIAAMRGGYGFWMELNADLIDVFTASYQMFLSSDPSIRQHVMERYERSFWNNYERTSQFDFTDSSDPGTVRHKMEFYPSLCF